MKFVNTDYVDYGLEERLTSVEREIGFPEERSRYLSLLSFAQELRTPDLNPEYIEKLRTACQLWDVDIRLGQVTSHRKIIGPVIIAIKKLLFPLVRFFLKDFVRQQKDFNAAVLALMIEGRTPSQK